MASASASPSSAIPLTPSDLAFDPHNPASTEFGATCTTPGKSDIEVPVRPIPEKEANQMAKVVSSADTADATDAVCAVCLNLLDDRETAETPCGHVFHSACLERWCKTTPHSASCPMCRRRLRGMIDLDDLSPFGREHECDDTVNDRCAAHAVHRGDMPRVREALSRLNDSGARAPMFIDYAVRFRSPDAMRVAVEVNATVAYACLVACAGNRYTDGLRAVVDALAMAPPVVRRGRRQTVSYALEEAVSSGYAEGIAILQRLRALP